MLWLIMPLLCPMLRTLLVGDIPRSSLWLYCLLPRWYAAVMARLFFGKPVFIDWAP